MTSSGGSSHAGGAGPGSGPGAGPGSGGSAAPAPRQARAPRPAAGAGAATWSSPTERRAEGTRLVEHQRLQLPGRPTLGRYIAYINTQRRRRARSTPTSTRSATASRSTRRQLGHQGAGRRSGTPTKATTGPTRSPRTRRSKERQGDASHHHGRHERVQTLRDRAGASSKPTAGTPARAPIFDLTSNALRHDCWTSADAAGLPVYPGLVRYDEVTRGRDQPRAAVHDAELAAGLDAAGAPRGGQRHERHAPPMGLRLRLKTNAHVNGVIAGAGAQPKVVLMALQKYGMIVADNGSNWYVSGEPAGRSDPPSHSWNDDDFHGAFDQINGGDFEVVKSADPIEITRDRAATDRNRTSAGAVLIRRAFCDDALMRTTDLCLLACFVARALPLPDAAAVTAARGPPTSSRRRPAAAARGRGSAGRAAACSPGTTGGTSTSRRRRSTRTPTATSASSTRTAATGRSTPTSTRSATGSRSTSSTAR